MKVGTCKPGSVQQYKKTAVLSFHTAFSNTWTWQNPCQSGHPAALLELPNTLMYHTGKFVVEVKIVSENDSAYGIRTRCEAVLPTLAVYLLSVKISLTKQAISL